MYHKSDKKSINPGLGKAISALLALITLAAGPVIYILLSRRHVLMTEVRLLTMSKVSGDALMYSLPYIWLVIIMSLICAIAVFAVANAMFKGNNTAPETEIPEAEEELPFDTVKEEQNTVVTNESLLEEYPELFAENETEEDPVSSSPDIASFFASDDTLDSEPEITESESETDKALREFMEEGTKENPEPVNFYENVASDLPEDYEIHSEPAEDLNDEIPEEDAEEIEYSRMPLIITAVAAMLVSALLAFCMSFNYTLQTEGSIIKRSLFNEKAYFFEEVSCYTVSSALNGDIKITAEMKDGAQFNLSPSSCVLFEAYAEKYKDSFDFILKTEQKLDAIGAKKEVKDRASIVSYYENEDGTLPAKIEKIIEEKN